MDLFKSLYPLFKEIAFKFDPEKVHDLTILSMKLIKDRNPLFKKSFDFQCSFLGKKMPSPIGLAAGLDKNAEAIDFLSSLPFGHIEVGTVTPKAQSGNDRPRLFRYPEINSLRNRMGFNNQGAKAVLKNLKMAKRHGKLIGVNLGKNKVTKNEDAHLDYAFLYKTFSPIADYLVINVSSPNTPGLRDLLEDSGLRKIFEATTVERKKDKSGCPLFVKISPDMEFTQIESVIELVKEYKLDGIIATNTTINKDFGDGGMSGAILYEKAKRVREFLLLKLKNNPEIELIGVGGFSKFSEIKEFWLKGGKFVQVYSSFIFNGPALLEDIEKELISEFIKFKVNDFESYLKKIRQSVNEV